MRYTSFDKVVLVNAAWGLGENVVQGAVDPDEYQVFKPLLSQPSLVRSRRPRHKPSGRIGHDPEDMSVS